MAFSDSGVKSVATTMLSRARAVSFWMTGMWVLLFGWIMTLEARTTARSFPVVDVTAYVMAVTADLCRW